MLDTDFNNKYEVKFTDEYIEELLELYEYVTKKLKEKIIAKHIIDKINRIVLQLESMPRRYMKIEKIDELKLEYHRIVINNFVILYSVDDTQRIVYVSHIIYGRRNYLK